MKNLAIKGLTSSVRHINDIASASLSTGSEFNSANSLAVSGSYVLVLNIYSEAQGSVTELNATDGSLVRVIK
jgi:hypothetical protein